MVDLKFTLYEPDELDLTAKFLTELAVTRRACAQRMQQTAGAMSSYGGTLTRVDSVGKLPFGPTSFTEEELEASFTALKARIEAMTPEELAAFKKSVQEDSSAPLVAAEGKPKRNRAAKAKDEPVGEPAAPAAEVQQASASTSPTTSSDAEPAAVGSSGEPQIRTNPEDRVEPVAEEPAVTRDTVRAALGKYVQAYGMDAAQADGPVMIADLFGADKTKVSDIPEDQTAFKAIIAKVEDALKNNPFKRTVQL